MNKVLKTILIISIVVYGNLLITDIVQAGENLEVTFGATPLFNEINFKPGDKVTAWVKVTNKSGATQKIATQAINVSNPDNFGDVLYLEIKEGTETRYSGTLSEFFEAGEVYLSDISSSTQYDFIVSFDSAAGNEYQGKSLQFDLSIGSLREEEKITLPVLIGGRGGQMITMIYNVKANDITEDKTRISWKTNLPSTSQVIYSAENESRDFDFSKPPKYGYAHLTPKYDVNPKVTFHSVTITGLKPGTTYYYRVVSRAPLAISREYSFTTLGVKEEEKTRERRIPPEEEISPPEGRVLGEEIVSVLPEEIVPPEKGVVPPEEEVAILPPEEKISEESLASLLLASLGVIRESTWMKILIIFCLIVLVLIGVREWELARRKKKQI